MRKPSALGIVYRNHCETKFKLIRDKSSFRSRCCHTIIIPALVHHSSFITMATNAILETLAHLAACSPCTGTFGKWKANLQDDDAELWNDLTLVNAIPGTKPPDIPKVVEVVSCSDGSDEDISTLAYDSYYHHPYHHSSPRRSTRSSHHRNYTTDSACREEEKSSTPSPKRGKGTAVNNETFADPDLELVLEEIDEDSGESDAELESIMGPRSQMSIARSHISRSIRRASSAPSVPFRRPTSLLRQIQQKHYQSPGLERHYSDSPSVTLQDSKEQERRDNFDENVSFALGRTEVDCGDGSSYSSANRKLSFFKTKRISLFRGHGNGSSYKKVGTDGGWLPLEHSEGSTEDTTVSTSTSKPKGLNRSHIRLKLKSFH